ncbi:hypothetical protein BHE74_00029921 [Ensete ventricosum]|nr:hypothetical protein BHE74_00029921 [Ensete ventricosum]
MLNSAKRDRIFSSMQFPKASSFASIASSDAIVYASRSIILRYFFCCRVSGMRILEKGVAGWKVNRLDGRRLRFSADLGLRFCGV